MFNAFINWITERNRLKDILRTVNKIGIHPYLVDGDSLSRALINYRPGDCILTYAALETTSILQGSKYTHASIGVHNARIVDATGSLGLAERVALSPMIGCGRICVLRPAIAEDLRSDIAFLASDTARKGIPYDWSFEPSSDALYCSEAYVHFLNMIVPGSIAMRERFGRLVIYPDDIRNDSLFDVVCEYEAEAYRD